MPVPARRRLARGLAATALAVTCGAAAGCTAGSPGGAAEGTAGGAPAGDRPAPAAPSAAPSGPVASTTTGTPVPPAGRQPRALPGMPALPDPRDVYAADRAGALAPAATRARPLVYVPNGLANTVTVIDQRTLRIVRVIKVGRLPQHVVPSYDLRTLWVTDDVSNDLVAIDPRTGRAVRRVRVLDPYNLYFTPDGRYAMVMAEAHELIDFRYPRSMRLHKRLPVHCAGVDHGDFTADGRWFLASCEFAGRMVVVDVARQRVARHLSLGGRRYMPQDVKLSPDGRTFYVADLRANGVWRIDARTWRVRGLVHTGRGAHGLYMSRDGRTLYVANRDEGSVSLLDPATGRHTGKWRIPPAAPHQPASPDMGNVDAAGTTLWLSGRYSSEVYAIDTRTGRLRARIRTGAGPHGLCVWPQPGRYSLGHTGILR